ncbi:hypothetical protein [Methylobacterium oryzihabitans]|uniref:Uncharacterized protein n=1 Tax=Methylobacterium oryzihabitans TaxID=2499852 RepID=A0A3S3U7N5_9HYPH|nr:hypothetical protein [Methylobacterium oryzihabitans]RVU17491.1 hypothetical protein EOE48_13975 [Methylobacterium oryzihabitans]
MFIRMLTSLAGDAFSYDHGETVAVDNAIGRAWIAAGIAEAAPATAAAEKAARDLRGQVEDLTARLADAEADRDALREQVAALAAQLAPAA